MKPVILFRKDYSTEDEFNVAQKYFDVKEYRSDVPENTLVIGRYSTLPFYKELEIDLKNNGARLVNSSTQYNWIANFEWYHVLSDYTFETWFRAQDVPEGIPLVVKGRTNSRKHEWDTKMFAPDKKYAIDIMIELQTDPLIGPQGLVFRRYEPLVTYEVGNNGLNFTNEYRCFFYKGRLLCFAYYWTMAVNVERELSSEGYLFAVEMGRIVADYSNFYVIDIAEKASGGWVVVEVNDGQMAGLSENNPHILYDNLKQAISMLN
jgi:hypothetical protein